MAKIINTYRTLAAAEEAVAQLTISGFDTNRLSIIGHGDKRLLNGPHLKKSLLWGGAMGAAATFLLPGGGHLFLAGHLARTVALHALGITAKGIATGLAAGGSVGLLRRAGLDHRAVKETAEAVAAGDFALVINGDWITTQRARRSLGCHRQQADPRLTEIVRRYGYEHQSFLSLYGGMKVWYAPNDGAVDAAVIYRCVGRVAIVAASPLAPRQHWAEATSLFLKHCEEQKLDCLMLPIGSEFAQVARQCGMALLRIGESGYFQLPAWRPAGDRAKKVRAGVNQARKAGVYIERYDPVRDQCELKRREIEELCQRWIDTREVDALGWLLELDPFSFGENKRYFLARKADGQLVGLLACSPIYARRGWYLEDLIRDQKAERGVSELLVVEALNQLAAEGAELATLATSPLAGLKPVKNNVAGNDPAAGNNAAGNSAESGFKHLSRLLNLIYEHLDTFYHFKALHRFKAKFAPSFIDPEYLAFYPPRIRLRMIFALIGAFDPAGFTGVLASKLRRLWKEARQSANNL
ncbi:MAG: DUF2156 domain-containing protein [Blastocatellia bacterium]